ncbi:MAG: TIGR03621 family F420-dependent LLM class oxidoreductase [Acidimicrobiales bacterium]
MANPFRFSVTAGSITNVTEFLELARKTEDLGYSTLTIPDHLDQQLAPIPALTAAAGVTSTLRLLTLVLANDYRHPVMTAKEAATLDLISDGRLELGIGAGWMSSDYQGAGLDYDKPSVRIRRLGEATAIIKGLFADGPVDFDGEFYNITALEGFPKPQQDSLPIMIAGGKQKILTLAAQQADIVGLNPGLTAGVIDERAGVTATPEATDEKLTWVKAGAGDRFDSLELQTRVHMAAIVDNRKELAETMGSGFGMTSEQALASPHVLVGSVEQCIETVQGWRERWGISYIGLSYDAVDQLAPVVAELAGT